MTTTTATRKRRPKPLDAKQQKVACEVLASMDHDLWRNKTKATQALAEFETRCGFRVTPTAFRSLRYIVCKWYRSGRLKKEQEAKAREVVNALDFRLWFDKRTLRSARAIVEVKCGFSLTSKEFSGIVADECKWFRQMRRPAQSYATALTETGWFELRKAVRRVKNKLHGRPLDEAVAIVSTQKRCNAYLLKGLTSDYRYWEHSS